MTKTVILLLWLSATLFGESIASLSDAINVSGKQRMYSQRFLKDYAMIGMQNNYGNPKNDLAQTIDVFQKSLQALQQFKSDTITMKVLKDEEEIWKKVKIILDDKANIERVPELQNLLEKLLKKADEATKDFVNLSKEKGSEIINIAGRQRMLSQRMASLYLIKTWGIKDDAFAKKLQDTMTLFKESATKLKSYTKNSEEINHLLTKVDRSFLFLEMMNRSKSKFIPALIYRKSDDILKDMDKVTKLYAKMKNR